MTPTIPDMFPAPNATAQQRAVAATAMRCVGAGYRERAKNPTCREDLAARNSLLAAAANCDSIASSIECSPNLDKNPS